MSVGVRERPPVPAILTHVDQRGRCGFCVRSS
jgi:hypothetical protein